MVSSSPSISTLSMLNQTSFAATSMRNLSTQQSSSSSQPYVQSVVDLMGALGSNGTTISKSLIAGLSSGAVPDDSVYALHQKNEGNQTPDELAQNSQNMLAQLDNTSSYFQQISSLVNQTWQQLNESGELSANMQEVAGAFVEAGQELAGSALSVLSQVKTTYPDMLTAIQHLDPTQLSQLAAALGLSIEAFKKQLKEMEDRMNDLFTEQRKEHNQVQMTTAVAPISADDNENNHSSSQDDTEVGSFFSTPDTLAGYGTDYGTSFDMAYLGQGNPVLIYLGISIAFTDLSTATLSTLSATLSSLNVAQTLLADMVTVTDWGSTYLNNVLDYEIKENPSTSSQTYSSPSSANWPIYEDANGDTVYVYNDSSNNVYSDSYFLSGGTGSGAAAFDSGTVTSTPVSSYTYYDTSWNSSSNSAFDSTYQNIIYYSLSFPTASENDLVTSFAASSNTTGATVGTTDVYFISPNQYAQMMDYVSRALGGFDGSSDFYLSSAYGSALTSSSSISQCQSSLSTILTALSSNSSTILTNVTNITNNIQSVGSTVASYISSYYSYYAKGLSG